MQPEFPRIPQHIEAERAILGACLLNHCCIDEMMETMQASDFYLHSHQVIAQAMLDMHARSQDVDLITLAATLESRKLFEKAGGPVGIAALIGGECRIDTIEPYARIVKHKAQIRAIMLACNSVLSMIGEDEDQEELVVNAQKLFWEACEHRQVSNFRRIVEIMGSYLETIERISSEAQSQSGIVTGYSEFDSKTLGMQKADLIILAGRPSQGKTTWSFNIADNASKSGAVVAYFSLEMPSERIGEKALSSNARIDSFKMRSGMMGRDDWARASDSMRELDSSKLFVCDQADLSVLEIKAKAQRLRRSEGLDLIVIDYLQLINGQQSRENSFEVVTKNVRTLKAIAKEMEIPILCLSQLNRSADTRASSEPELADLRSSGDIEQVADIVAFIYRGEIDGTAAVKIGKNRNGPTGKFELTYLRAFNRFESMYGG